MTVGARSRLWLVPLLGVIALTYAFYFTAGKFADPPVRNYYYDFLAEGFRSGHLHLSVLPNPILLAQANPYEYRFRNLWLVDVSLYRGKYYLYWGPLPALLQALTKSMFRIDRMIGDQYLTFAFLSGSAILGALLIERITRRLFDRVPRWQSALGIAAFAFANPVLYLIATSGVYQAAITGGQVFVLAGLLFAFDAVWHGADPTRGRWRLVLSGTAFGLALCCRNSLGFCVVLLIGATALATSWSSETRLRTLIAHGVYLGTPVAIAVFALLAYNEARFGAWLEFGTHWQLTTVPLRVSADYVAANLASYALASFDVSCRFPYALQSWVTGPKGLPSWLSVPHGYSMAEPVSGVLRAVPLTWLVPIALVAAIHHARRFQSSSLPRATPPSESERRRIGYVWCAVCFALLGTVGGAVILGFYFATMRYLADVTFGLVALSLLGGYSLITGAASRSARMVSAGVFATLAASTIVLGLLLGYQGYDNQFKLFNPELDSKIVQALSVCR